MGNIKPRISLRSNPIALNHKIFCQNSSRSTQNANQNSSELSTYFRVWYLENFPSLFKRRISRRQLVGSRWGVRLFYKPSGVTNFL